MKGPSCCDQGEEPAGERHVTETRPELQMTVVIARGLDRTSLANVGDRARCQRVDCAGKHLRAHDERVHGRHDHLRARTRNAIKVTRCIETLEPVDEPALIGHRLAAQVGLAGVVVEHRWRESASAAGLKRGRGECHHGAGIGEPVFASVVNEDGGYGHWDRMLT